MKVEVAVLGSPPSLMVRMVLCGRNSNIELLVSELKKPCESRGGRPGLPVPNGPYGLCGRQNNI